MRKVTLARPQKVVFPFSKGKILVDYQEKAIVKAGKTVVFEIPDGRHDIQIIFNDIPPTHSNPVRIEETDGDVSLEVKIIVPLTNNSASIAELKRV